MTMCHRLRSVAALLLMVGVVRADDVTNVNVKLGLFDGVQDELEHHHSVSKKHQDEHRPSSGAGNNRPPLPWEHSKSKKHQDEHRPRSAGKPKKSASNSKKHRDEEHHLIPPPPPLPEEHSKKHQDEHRPHSGGRSKKSASNSKKHRDEEHDLIPPPPPLPEEQKDADKEQDTAAKEQDTAAKEQDTADKEQNTAAQEQKTAVAKTDSDQDAKLVPAGTETKHTSKVRHHGGRGVSGSVKFLIGLASSVGVVSLIMMLNAIFKRKTYRYETEELPTVEYEGNEDKFFLDSDRV